MSRPEIQLSPEAENLANEMKKRAALYETDAEKAIYVDMPECAMEFDELIKSHQLLQQSTVQQISDTYQEILRIEPEKLLDIDKITETLKYPPQSFLELEQFLRERVFSVQTIEEKITKWIYIVSTEQDEAVEKIQEAMTQIEDACSQVIESLLEYHQTRGKLISKLLKRRLYDVAKTLAQFDIAQANDVKNAFVDLYNCIISAYDTSVQAFEQIKQGNSVEKSGTNYMY